MKTTLYLTGPGFQLNDSNLFQIALNGLSVDETIVWEGDNSVLKHEISSFPCLIVEETNELLYEGPEVETIERVEASKVFEHRRNHAAAAITYTTKLAALQGE